MIGKIVVIGALGLIIGGCVAPGGYPAYPYDYYGDASPGYYPGYAPGYAYEPGFGSSIFFFGGEHRRDRDDDRDRRHDGDRDHDRHHDGDGRHVGDRGRNHRGYPGSPAPAGRAAAATGNPATYAGRAHAAVSGGHEAAGHGGSPGPRLRP